MLRINSHPVTGRSGINRREWLQAGGISALGLSWADLLLAQQARSSTGDQRRPVGFGRAKSCVVVFQFGGPSQQDLWDLKPDAPTEVRGEFRPIDTNVEGIQIGELLPQLAQQADKFVLARSVTHRDFEHGSAAYTALTGKPHPLPGTNTPARQEDFPTYGAVMARKRPTSLPLPSAVVLGPVMHQGNRPPLAGQNAGFLGAAYDPFRIAGDPNSKDFQVVGLQAPEDLSTVRLDQRAKLLHQLEQRWREFDRSGTAVGMSQLKQRAFNLLGSADSQRAFDLSREKAQVREQYGRHRFGQTMLLSRRLVEAGTPLVTVNWSKLNADQWDTHSKNYSRLRELLPPFDQGMAAFISDLEQRGLLETTLVVCLGEFGRTPKMNKDAGRDHWPDCYSVLMAGGGLKQGVVFGASDRQAAFPDRDPIGPWDIAATCYHLLGIDPRAHLHDREQRPYRIADGRVVRDLIA
ncbi:MAG: DUF1501 domain-containing protein [Planctomycetes bacterium]|nr:DUF1501 domain-containing protein [Planctomycetota bacterium]